MNRPYILVLIIRSMILVVIKLYVLSVILCGDSRHHYRAVCRNYSMCVFAVVMCMLQYVLLWRLILSYLIFGTAVIGLHAVADSLPLCMYSSCSMHYTWRIK